MTRLSESPPDYSEFDDLIANLTDLDLSATPNLPPLRSPRTPPPNRPIGSPGPTPQTPRRPATHIYEFESPSRSGRTTQWSEASFYSQGVSDGRVRVIAKSPKPPHKKKKAFVVFFGRCPGVYHSWFGTTGAERQVKGMLYAVSQGYSTVEEAQEAFNYARERSWTGVRGSGPPSLLASALPAIPTIPQPLTSNRQTHNPLHGATASAPK
ncbi:hypothetical protein B0H13DRAFT_1871103 [Mycena leptocephala]|nr:hypothetical protein B0H13DRAFT_1871103 [Mycena leptocephala]